MTLHGNHKGIIHTTTYEQVNFIKENISEINKRRLLQTNPEIPRDEVITKHVNSTEPTVLISPSLYMGLDLKDDRSTDHGCLDLSTDHGCLDLSTVFLQSFVLLWSYGIVSHVLQWHRIVTFFVLTNGFNAFSACSALALFLFPA